MIETMVLRIIIIIWIWINSPCNYMLEKVFAEKREIANEMSCWSGTSLVSSDCLIAKEACTVVN